MRNSVYTLALATLILLLGAQYAFAIEPVPEELQGMELQENIGDQVDPTIRFVRHTGEEITVRDFLYNGRPTLLTLNYYSCPMLCGLELNALLDSLTELDWFPGEDYQIITVSFDDREGPDLAAIKRTNYLAEAGLPDDTPWEFWTGDEDAIMRLTQAVGFPFRYIEETGEFAHPAALVFLSEDGTITRYLPGLAHTPSDMRRALLEASEGTLGSPLDRLVLSCFHYDPNRGEYVPYAFGIMRLAGALTVIVLSLFLGLLFMVDRARQSATTSTH